MFEENFYADVVAPLLHEKMTKRLVLRQPPDGRILREAMKRAHGHLDYLQETGDPATGLPIGDTSSNLAASVAGETHEYTDMYPGMARTARDEGFDEIADWFETLAKAEKSHAGRFQKALDTME